MVMEVLVKRLLLVGVEGLQMWEELRGLEVAGLILKVEVRRERWMAVALRRSVDEERPSHQTVGLEEVVVIEGAEVGLEEVVVLELEEVGEILPEAVLRLLVEVVRLQVEEKKMGEEEMLEMLVAIIPAVEMTTMSRLDVPVFLEKNPQ